MLKNVFSTLPIHLLMSSLKAANWSEKHNKTLESTTKKWRGQTHALRRPQMGREDCSIFALAICRTKYQSG